MVNGEEIEMRSATSETQVSPDLGRRSPLWVVTRAIAGVSARTLLTVNRQPSTALITVRDSPFTDHHTAMRISTSGMHYNALTAMLQQQSVLSKIQNQIALGKRVNTPADDPAAAVHILELQRALQESDQYKANADIATNRLSLEEQSLQDVSALLARVRELAVQGNNAPLDAQNRRMIAIELRQRLQELVDIANRRDAHGEYLFAGYSTSTRPFSNTAAGVSYYGDQGNRLLQVGPEQRVADSHSSYDVFLKIPEGNGTFVLGAAADNTGAGVLGAGSVVDRAAWQAAAGDYTVRFTSDTG